MVVVLIEFLVELKALLARNVYVETRYEPTKSSTDTSIML